MDSFKTIKVRVTGVSSNNGVYTVQVGQEKFSFWEKKQDGNDTVAFETFKQLGVKLGDEVGISYKENKKQNRYGTMSTYRNIMSFLDPEDITVQEYNQPQNQDTRVVEPIKERDFEAEVRGKVRHGVVTAMIQAGFDLERATLEVDGWVNLIYEKNDHEA